jgi:hypothetical protein
MTNAELERLAWERLDGTISAEDRHRLDAMLVADGSARQRFDAIQEVARGLAGVAQIRPPAELRPRIDRAVATAAPPRWRGPIATMDLWRPRLVYLAAGLVMGAIATRLLLPAPALDRDLASGAMIASSVGRTSVVTVELGGEGTLALSRTGALLNLDLSVREPHQLEVTLQGQGGSLGIERVVLSQGLAAEAVADRGSVRIRATGRGRGAVAVSQRGGDSVISVRVSSNGVLLAEREVRPDELRAGR